MDTAPYSGIELKMLTTAIAEAEVEHHQHIPQSLPVGCSCGITYREGFEWEESKQHLREVAARATLGALHRPCDHCLGSGIWRRLRRDYECPECGGRGRTLTPLPPMTFQDPDGDTWVVDGFEARDRGSVWTQVFRDA
jgi:hypothetical protein